MEMHSSTICGFIVVFLALVDLSTVCTAEPESNFTGKPGVCPHNSGMGLCVEYCFDDSDCPNDEKCCSNGCGHDCIAPYTGVCPRSLEKGLCVEFCSDDSDCLNNEKCCFNGCGHVCIAVYTVKPGRCALPEGTPMCGEYCYHDGQCPGEQKCCETTCGHTCSEPY